MGTRGGRLIAAFFAAVRVALAAVFWPLPFRRSARNHRHRSRLRRFVAIAAVAAVLVPSGRAVLTHPRAPWNGYPRTTIGASTVGVLPLSKPLAAARLSEGHSVETPHPVAVVAPSKRNALIIGINHARGSKPLQGSITDAKNVRTALLRYGFPARNISMLVEGAATRGAVLAGIRSLAARTPASGLAVFAVATHSRIRHGENKLVTADGEMIGAHELAGALGQIRGQTFSAFATCYAEGYALRGVVGHNRIAVFGSSAHQLTYQIGEAGSYLIINMVKRAMIDGYAPRSIEESFAYAKRTLEETHPNRVPLIHDDIPGDVALGPVTWRIRSDAPRRPEEDPYAQPFQPSSETTSQQYPSSEPTPSPDDDGDRQSVVGVCGRFRYQCDQ